MSIDQNRAGIRSMTAWRQRRYGGADAVTAETVAVPRPKRGEVLVRTEAVGLNSGDIHVMRGEPRLVRLFFGLRGPRVRTRGMDLAGVVAEVGEGVTEYAVGDAVVAGWRATLADFVTVPVGRLSRRPAQVPATDAATLPIAGNTAVGILDTAGVREGSRVLVLGAGGGVGTLTVQLAADRGAEVWATCGARAESLLRELGAARTLDYRTTPLSSLPADSFDAIVDIAGEPPLPLLRGLLRAGGTVALVGGEGGRILGPIPRMLRAAVAGRSGRRFRSIAAVTKAEVTAGLLALVAEGRLTPAIERTYPLSEAAAALAHVDSGRTVGKVVVVSGS